MILARPATHPRVGVGGGTHHRRRATFTFERVVNKVLAVLVRLDVL